MTTKTFYKTFFAWQDEKEEKWLEEQAAQGWHLESAAPFFYTFRKGNPERVIYRLDYKLTVDKDYAEYTLIFQDSHWELVTRMSNWHYYCIRPENDQTPEIFSSSRTKAQKYRRLLRGLLPLLLLAFLNFRYIFEYLDFTKAHDTGDVILGLFMLLVWGTFIFAVITVVIKIRRLESESRE